MGTTNYNLPKISGTASVKVPRDVNALADAVDQTLNLQLMDVRKNTLKSVFTAHRGLNNAFPENTLLAFEMACLAGYKVIELDIQPSAEGVLVVHHDLTLERMTNGAGQVSAQTLSQLKTLTIDGGIAANEYPNIKIPTLEETLALFRRYNVKPMIEFKLINDYAQLNTLVDLLKVYGMEYNSSIISPVTYLIREFRARGGKSECLYLNSVTPESTALLKEYGNCGYCLNYLSTTESLVKAIHAENLSVAVYTVNDVSIARNLSRWGVEYITTDTIRGVS
ncbi:MULTISPECIES: glycerophosphodiester phosphodiesterase family protein [Exiguobacterium]|uniref:glycerophosphodiester phosphodiesterase n=1 Tax=Exiguobacterium TaxID=33986 RepID=UPI001AEA6C4C|nr:MULTISPECIES: glycerophosphodiester phosphodiesterase family protein [Exiguobacterium]MCT4779811.1 hypothetical protein [Exiguobacterium soli]